MGRNRRNKRNIKLNIDEISNKNFIIIACVFVIIILICISVISIKNHNNKLEMARQKEILDKQIAAIFESEIPKIEENKTTQIKADTIVNISVTGDILCNDELIADANKGDSYDFTHMFENVKEIIDNSDIAIGTMETNFTDNKFSDYIKCNSPKEFAQAVKKSGIDLVSVAHNHALDYGYEGLKSTNNYLSELGFETVGVKVEENQARYIVKEIKGIKITFLAYTYGMSRQSSLSSEQLQYINIFDKELVKQDIENAKKESEYIFVIMHWGDVNKTTVSKEQEDIANFLVENGANAIVGSHPAVIEPMEVVQNSNGENVFIAYSLGNYISYLGYDLSNLELILNIQIRKDGETGKVALDKVTYTPIYVLDNGRKVENRFELVDIKKIAKQYVYENSEILTKKQYNKLIDGLEKIEEIIRSR